MALLSWSDRTKKKRMLYFMEERKITRMLFMDFFCCLAEVFYSFKELSSLSYFLPSVIVIQHDNRRMNSVIRNRLGPCFATSGRGPSEENAGNFTTGS